MRTRAGLAAGALLFCILAGPAQAQSGAGLTICNRAENGATYLVAMIVRWPFILQEQWESSGWYRIEPGRCERWSRGNVNTLFLLSVTEVTDRGRLVLDYGVEDIPNFHWDTGSYGMEEFYCVSDDRFRRTATDESEYRLCERDEYEQLFNVHIFVEHNSSFTLNLR